MPLSNKEVIQVLLVAYLPPIFASTWGLPAFLTGIFLSYPLMLIAITFALPILALIYTAPFSPLRLAVVPFIATGVVCFHKTGHQLMQNQAVVAGLSGPFLLHLLVSIDALCLQRLYLNSTGKERSETTDREKKSSIDWPGRNGQSSTRQVGLLNALGWSARVVFSYRAIASPREAKNIPRFSSRDPRYVPSRSRFLLQRSLSVIILFLVVDILSHQPPSQMELFTPHNASLFIGLHQLSTQAIVARVLSTGIFWFSLRLTIALIYNAASIIGVALMITCPADWPPYFGSVGEAYTLRKFWAKFWHAGLRNPCLATANFFAFDVLRLRKHSLLARYLSMFFTFYISGTIHMILDVMSGIPVSECYARRLFVMQTFGIMLEDAVEALSRTARLGKTPPALEDVKYSVDRSETWQKVLGYAWVFAFLVWTTPSWSYANIRHDGDPLFPFSLVPLLQNVVGMAN